MTQDNFYTLLPSNSDSSGTPSKYRVNYIDPINLSNYSEWEVGLMEMSFVDAIKTITDETIDITSYGTLSDGNDSALTLHDLNNVQQLQDAFTESGFDSYFNLDLNGKYVKITIKMTPDMKIVGLRLSGGLAYLLGYELTPIQLFDLQNQTFVIMNAQSRDGIRAFATEEAVLKFNENNEAVATIEFNLARFVEIRKDELYSWRHQYLPVIIENITFVNKHFTTREQLVKSLNNDTVQNYGFKFELDPIQNVLTLSGEPLQATTGNILYLTGKIAEILGFRKEIKLQRQLDEEVRVTAEFPPDLRRSIYSIYVYCSICEPVLVGTRRVPLLRSVSFNTGKYGETISVLYSTPVYVSVNAKYINNIEVELRDDMGELIPFVEGKTSLLLHFRRRL